MKGRSTQVTLLIVCALALTPWASADVVRLGSGKILEGRIEEQTGESIRLRMHRGTFIFPSKTVSTTDEGDAVDYYRLALQARQVGDLQGAKEWLELSTASEDSPDEAQQLLAAVDLELTRREIAPELKAIHLHARKQEYRTAIRKIDKLLEDYDKEAIAGEVASEAASLLADYAWYLYDHFAEDQAMEVLKRAREVGGEDHPAIHYTLARIAEMDQNFEAALDEYELAAAQQSAWRDVQRRLATVRAERERQPVKAPVTPAGDIDSIIRAAATRHSLSPSFVKRIVLLESSGRHNARSEADARGLMQIRRPAWEDMTKRLGVDWGFEEKSYIPENNIEIGCAYLAWLRDAYFPQHQEDIEDVSPQELLLQGYHAGPARTVYYKGNVPGRRTRAYLTRYRSMVADNVGEI